MIEIRCSIPFSSLYQTYLLSSFIKHNDKDYVLTMLNIDIVVYFDPNEPNLFETDKMTLLDAFIETIELVYKNGYLNK